MKPNFEKELTGTETGATVEEVTHYIKKVKKLEEELIRNEIGIEIDAWDDTIKIVLDKDSIAYPKRTYKADLMIRTEFLSLERVYDTVMSRLNEFLSEVANIENPLIDKMVAVKNEKIQNQRV